MPFDNEVDPIYVYVMLALTGASYICKYLDVCEEKTKMDGMTSKILTDSAIDLEWKFDHGRPRRTRIKLIVLHKLPFLFVDYRGFKSFVKT